MANLNHVCQLVNIQTKKCSAKDWLIVFMLVTEILSHRCHLVRIKEKV